ncbi:MAG: CZB domain-containing protein [Alphaproteobacteria bacterium]|nr:CZB domain-containing protein [Alphaproteobacteria bacterium]
MLDVGAARLSHLRWQMALERFIRGSEVPDSLRGHDDCALGRWLAGEGLRLYGENQRIWVLKVAHKRFHRLADQILGQGPSSGDQGAECLEKLRRVSRDILFLLTSLELDASGRGREPLRTRFLKWLRSRTRRSDARRPLSVTEARLAHLRWLGQLQDVLSGSGAAPERCSAASCPLGVWIDGVPNEIVASNPDVVRALDDAHQRFHQAIETTMTAQSAGDLHLADEAYGDASDFSAEVVFHLTNLELAMAGSGELASEEAVEI